MAEERRCALVTGGSRGIGRAICLRLAENGCDVAVNYVGNRELAEETAARCRELGARAVAIQADVSNAAACERLVEETVRALGRIDVLINNAGITRDALLIRIKEEEVDSVLAANLKGALFCSKAAAKHMMKQRYGRIIQISSIVGLHGNVGQSVYAASKAALIGLTKSMARETAGRGVTVNAVAPGYIETDMAGAMPDMSKEAFIRSIPLARAGRAEDVAQAVAFLVDADYITGQVLGVDGGMGM